MTGNIPAHYTATTYAQATPSGGKSAYYQLARAGGWEELETKLEEAVREGRLTQAQANRILAHIERRATPA